MKVFWSWQADLPGSIHRHFIKDALEDAISAISAEFEVDDADRPNLDHATKGVSGAADIAHTVLEKIAEAAVFVADVTPVAETQKGKGLPNPNVMIELGWSLNRPGWQRQIYILNTADGWTPDDLPFDIRGRLVMRYSLAEGADGKEKASARKTLARELEAAIRANLKTVLEERAAEQPIAGMAADPETPSIWAGATAGFSHQNSSENGGWKNVAIESGPRAYMRIIPSGWKSQPPSVSEALRLYPSRWLDVYTRYREGDFGPTENGFVNYWRSSAPDSATTTEDVAMFFEETGEFWILQGSALWEDRNGVKAVELAQVFKCWSAALRRANWIFDHYGALPVRRVEVGFTGFKGARLPGMRGGQSIARRDTVMFDMKGHGWSKTDRQRSFLFGALRKVFDAFALQSPSDAEATTFLDANDVERNLRNPFTQ